MPVDNDNRMGAVSGMVSANIDRLCRRCPAWHGQNRHFENVSDAEYTWWASIHSEEEDGGLAVELFPVTMQTLSNIRSHGARGCLRAHGFDAVNTIMAGCELATDNGFRKRSCSVCFKTVEEIADRHGLEVVPPLDGGTCPYYMEHFLCGANCIS